MSSKLVVCGSIAVDRIMNFQGKYKNLVEPEKLDVFSISVLIDELKESRGGTGANISYHLAKIGEEPILMGSVGENARQYINDLDKVGVDVNSVHFSQLPTASFSVINDSDSNQVGGFYPGAMADSDMLNLNKYEGKDVIVMVSAHDPASMKNQVRQCADKKLRLVYDVSQQLSSVSSEDIIEGIDAAELIIVNDYELSLMSKKSGISTSELISKVQIFITTHGSKGSLIQGAKIDEDINVNIAKPKKITDPTGAGDGYRAGFLYGYTRNWELLKCGQLGAVIASFVVEEFGSQVEYTKQMVQNRYKENFNEEIEL